MRTVTVDMVGRKEREGRVLKLIKKTKASITKAETILGEEGEEDFFNLKFDIGERKFRKNARKFTRLGDFEITT